MPTHVLLISMTRPSHKSRLSTLTYTKKPCTQRYDQSRTSGGTLSIPWSVLACAAAFCKTSSSDSPVISTTRASPGLRVWGN
jgi:hypothetical protein